MKVSLSSEMKLEQKELTEKIVRQELETQRRKYEEQIEQLKQMFTQMKQMKEMMEQKYVKYKAMASMISHEKSVIEVDQQKRTALLQHNLGQIQEMYQSLSQEKSIMKMDLQVADRKNKRLKEKLATLEKQLDASRQKQQDYLTIIKQLKQEFLNVQNQQLKFQQLTESAQQAEEAVLEPQKGPARIVGGGQVRNRQTIRGGKGRV